MTARSDFLQSWLTNHFKTDNIQITPLQGDASFRRYFRIQHNNTSYIVMDAPPELEDVHPFVHVTHVFSAHNIHVPHIFAENLEHGFLLLTDFGDRLYFKELNADNVDELYKSALETLVRIQTCQVAFPPFDAAFIQKELDNFEHWFLERHLTIKIRHLHKYFKVLIDSAINQPQVCVHRDYHSRNLVCLDSGGVGVLDFQDAVWGPVTYDAVSLLRDCYIDWPREQVETWANDFYKMAGIHSISADEFLRCFDLMGVQRHLKALFIFARKYIRDDSHHYLPDIPRTFQYVLDVSENYPELSEFRKILVGEVAPRVLLS
jgi:N-acetylmuramate 1-kinase